MIQYTQYFRDFLAKIKTTHHPKKHKHKGFTLIEVLVSLVISGMVFAAAIGSYWVLTKSHMKNEIYREMLRQTNFSMTRITDQIRNQGIDYTAYQIGGSCEGVGTNNGADISGNPILCLNDIIFFAEKAEVLPPTSPATYFYKLEVQALDNQTPPQPINSPLFSHKFEVEYLNISFTPTQDPSSTMETYHDLQPKVNIIMKVRYKADHDINFELQTTVSARDYKF